MISLFIVFLKTGFLGFGGGYAIVSLLLSEAQKLGLTYSQFADLMAVDLVVPGPVAINAATYIGYLVSGIGGALVATFAVCIPSFVLVPLAMHFLKKLEGNKLVENILDSVKAAAVGMILSAAGLILLAEFKVSLSLLIPEIIILLAVIILAGKYKINPILLTLLSGIAGALFLK